MEKTCPTRVACAAVAALTLAWLTTAQPPAAQPQTPGFQPQTPGFQPQTPGGQPQTPGFQPQTPGGQPQTPGFQPQTPGGQPQIPGFQPQTPGFQPQTPGVQPQTPGGQPQTPGLQPQTPGLQPQTPGDQPQTPGAQPQAACSARFEAAVTPKCFDASGVNFTGIIYLLSGNRSGSIPTGYSHQSFVQFICGQEKQDTIIPCVLAQMQEHNTSQCTAEDRAVLFGRGGQLLAFLESICGQPCEQDSTQSLVQCYAAINVNPEHILSQNASIVEDKYTIVGKNDTEFDNFCRNRQKLFSCLGPLSSMCPGLLQRLYLIGIDLQAMETVSGVLCSDKQGYLKGLTCASTPSPDMAQCSQVTATNMRAAVQGRFQTGSIVPSKYMENLCKTKLTQMACELPAYGKSCDADAVAVRTSVECGMLPKPCRENPQFQSDYNAVCQKVTTQTPIQVVRPTQGQPGIMPGGGPIPSATSPTVATGKSRSSSADYLRLSTAAFMVTSGVLLLAFT